MQRIVLLGATAALAAFFVLAGATTFIALSAGEGDAGSHLPRLGAESTEERGGTRDVEVLEIEMEGDSERPEWEVEVVGADGLLREVSVDATSGEVVGSKTEEPGEETHPSAPIGLREAETRALEALAVQSTHFAGSGSPEGSAR